MSRCPSDCLFQRSWQSTIFERIEVSRRSQSRSARGSLWSCLILLATWLCLPPLTTLGAAPREIRFRRIGTEHGLSHPNVRCIHQDKQGFLWFGTEDGLNRFDGYEFKIFRPDPQGDQDEVRAYDVRTIHEDDEGYLWIGGMFSRRIDRFDPRKHRFEHFRAHGMGHVLRFHERSAGVLWLGTSWTGLWKFQPSSNQFKHYPLDVLDTKQKRLGAGTIHKIFSTKTAPNILWLSTERRGLVRFDANAEKLESINDNEHLKHKIPAPRRPISFLSDSENLIWVGGSRNDTQLYRFDAESLQFVDVIPFNQAEDGSVASGISLLRDHDGRIWAGLHGGGIAQFHSDSRTFDHYFYDTTTDRTIGSNIVRDLYQDRSGMVWAITPPAGLSVFDPRPKCIKHYEPLEPVGNQSTLIVECLYCDNDGAVWLGTRDSGLVKWNRETGVETFHLGNNNQQGMPANLILSLGKRRQGGFWIGGRRGLRYYDPKSDSIRNYEAAAAQLRQLEEGRIYAVHEDAAGKLWLGRDQGFVRVDFEMATAIAFEHDPTDASSIFDGPVKQILEDRSGRIWAAGPGGLQSFDRKKEAFIDFLGDPSDAASLEASVVLGLYEDSTENVLWVSTETGLIRLDIANGAIRRITTEDGLPSNVVFGATEDKDGELWVNTKRGVARISGRNTTTPQVLSFRNNAAGQFVEPKTGQLVDDEGRIYFNRLRGFTEIRPQAVRREQLPNVVLTDFQLLNESIPPGPLEDSVLSTDISRTDRIELDHGQNKVITFRFSSLNNRSHDSVQYAYRLDGLQDDWNYSEGRNRSATYSTLIPGDYTFRVKATNSQGVWGKEASLQLKILPPWWKTWWFYCTTAVALVSLTAGMIRWRNRAIHKQNRVLALSEQRYVNLLANTSEQMFCVEFDEPIPLDLPEQEQFERVLVHGRFVEVNEALAKVYDATVDEVIGWPVARILPRSHPSTLAFLEKLVRARYRLVDAETVEVDKHGNTVVNLNTFMPTIVDEKVTRVWGTARDVTHLREVEEQIRLRQTAIDNTNDGFAIADARQEDYPLVHVNDRFLQITGYERPEVLGRNCRFLQGSETDPEVVQAIQAALEAGECFEGELLNYRKSGEAYWNYLRLSPVFDKHSKLTHYVGVISDVTGRKSTEELVRQQRQELAHVSRVATLGEIGAALAHELNQPLAGILRYAQAAVRYLDRDVPNVERARQNLTDIIKDDRRAGDVVSRIRQHLKKEEPARSDVDLNEVIRSSVDLLHTELIIKQALVDLELEPDLPKVRGDAVELQQVTINLVLNAVEAMGVVDESRRKVVIATKSASHGDDVEVSVCDSGPGIEQHQLEQVFRPFVTMKKKGMGVGLAINRTIIEGHDGRIWAENRPSGGARIVFQIPALPETARV